MLRTDGSLHAMNKKGLSNLVATVLLIVFVVSLALIVTNWSGQLLGGSIEKSKVKIGTELECQNINLRLESWSTEEKYRIIIKNNNKGGLGLKGFITRFIIKNGNAVVDYSNQETEIKNFEAKDFNFQTSVKKSASGENLNVDMTQVEQIEIIPRVDIGEKVECETKKVSWKF